MFENRLALPGAVFQKHPKVNPVSPQDIYKLTLGHSACTIINLMFNRNTACFDPLHGSTPGTDVSTVSHDAHILDGGYARGPGLDRYGGTISVRTRQPNNVILLEPPYTGLRPPGRGIGSPAVGQFPGGPYIPLLVGHYEACPSFLLYAPDSEAVGNAVY